MDVCGADVIPSHGIFLASPGAPSAAIPRQPYHCQCVFTRHNSTHNPTVAVESADTRLSGHSCDDQSLTFEDSRGTLLRQVCAPYDVLFERYASKTVDLSGREELRMTFHQAGNARVEPSLFLLRARVQGEGTCRTLTVFIYSGFNFFVKVSLFRKSEEWSRVCRRACRTIFTGPIINNVIVC